VQIFEYEGIGSSQTIVNNSNENRLNGRKPHKILNEEEFI